MFLSLSVPLSIKLQGSRLWGTRERINTHKRIEQSPEIDPHINYQLIFDKGAKVRRKNLQQVVFENLDIHMQKMDLNSHYIQKLTLNRS